MATEGYIVTRPHPGSGVGSNLASLGGALWCAQRLRRSVIVDWRESAFLKDKSLNYFTEFFETPPVMQGVPVEYTPCHLPDDCDERVAIVGVTKCREALRTGAHPARYLVLRDYHGLDRLAPDTDPGAHFWWMKQFYTEIGPRRFIAETVKGWAEEHLSDAFIIGANISTGNGEFAKGGPSAGRVDLGIFDDGPAFLTRIERARRRALRDLPRKMRERTKLFFATDSYAMHDLLLRVPGSVTRRQRFPPPGVGRVYCDYNDPDYTDRDAIVDALVDMLLLAHCQALIRNGTVFSAYALTVTGYFSGNVQHIESFYVRYWLKVVRNHLLRLLKR